MLESGPAGGVVGSIALCEALDLDNAICFDMGGTTAKACVVRRGAPELSAHYFVGGYNEGLAIRIPCWTSRKVGMGGGSARLDDQGGALHVGPESPLAEPGPVSYGRGRHSPHRDRCRRSARIVISAEHFLGGEMRLNVSAAAEAIERDIASPLDLA